MIEILELENVSLQYLAGFFDGEGSIGIYQPSKLKKPNNWILSATVTQRCDNAHILFWLKKNYGGTISAARNSIKNPKWSDVYKWSVSLRKAERFIRDIYPYLIVKKRQADIAIKMMEDRRPQARPWKDQEGVWSGEGYAKQIRELNSSRIRLDS